MTLRFQFFYYSDDTEQLDVSISRGGEMSFNNADIEYEIAYAAMGGRKSRAMECLDAWDFDPWPVVRIMTDNDITLCGRFLTDCVEHVLPLYKKEFPEDLRLRQAVIAARDQYISPGRDWVPLNDAKMGAFRAMLEAVHYGGVAGKTPAGRVAEAAYAMMNLTTFMAQSYNKSYVGELITDAINTCAETFGEDNVFDKGNHDLSTGAIVKESAWQWRRFYDIVTALRAGRDWPDLKETP
jgi:hypothetical protein